MGLQDRGRRGITATDQAIKLKGASWLEPTGGIVLFDDFLGKALNATDIWTSTATASGTAAVDGDAGGATSAGHGGWVVLSVTADADAIELGMTNEALKGQFLPNRAGKGVLVFQARLIHPALTTIWTNYGFTDDETEGAAIAMSLSTATWTTTATDAVLGGIYSTATDATHKQFIGVKANVDTASVASALTTTADIPAVVRIEIDSGGNAYFYEGAGDSNTDPAFQGTVPNAVTVTVPMIPYLAAAGTAASTQTLEVDYVLAACAR